MLGPVILMACLVAGDEEGPRPQRPRAYEAQNPR